MKKKQKSITKSIASQRIKRLFELAAQEESESRRNRYVALARKIGMRHRVRIPMELRMKFCRRCNSYFSAGTYRVRVADGCITTTCLKCGNVTRRPY